MTSIRTPFDGPRRDPSGRCRRAGWYYWTPSTGSTRCGEDGVAPRGDELPALSFFDEDDEPRRTPRPRRARPAGGGVATADSQTLLIRRAVALVGGILVLLLLLFFVNSCRDRQRENALKDYNRQLSTIATDSASQVGAPFFQLLEQGGGSQPQELQTEISSYRVHGRAAVRAGQAARRAERDARRPAGGPDGARVAPRRPRPDRAADPHRARRRERAGRRGDQRHRGPDGGVHGLRRGLGHARDPVHHQRARGARRSAGRRSAARRSWPAPSGCSRRRSPRCSTSSSPAAAAGGEPTGPGPARIGARLHAATATSSCSPAPRTGSPTSPGPGSS